MIHDIDASLRALIERDVLAGSDVDVAFESPTRDWAARRTKPTVNVFLYDIREDMSRRQMDFERVVDGDGKVTGRKRPPRRFKLSYLVTAWTQRPEDEHRLLSAVLLTLLGHDTIPRDVLTGALASQSHPVLLHVGTPPPKAGGIADVWSAMGGELKPSLDVGVVAPFDPDLQLPAGPPVEEAIVSMSRKDGPGADVGDGQEPTGNGRPDADAAAGRRRT